MRSFKVLGVPIHECNLDSVLKAIETRLACEEAPAILTVTGVHGVIEAHSDRTLLPLYEAAWINVADGQPLVLAGKSRGWKVSRVRGFELLPAVCRWSSGKHKNFFFGGSASIALRLKENFSKKFPGFECAGEISPPFRDLSEEEIKSYAQQIESSGARLIWIGISTPKQERLMSRLSQHLKTGILIGVGGAFDYHAGKIQKEAPQWMRGLALEWLYRLIQEPQRLYKRYLKIVPAFLFLYAKEHTGDTLRYFFTKKPQ